MSRFFNQMQRRPCVTVDEGPYDEGMVAEAQTPLTSFAGAARAKNLPSEERNKAPSAPSPQPKQVSSKSQAWAPWDDEALLMRKPPSSSGTSDGSPSAVAGFDRGGDPRATRHTPPPLNMLPVSRTDFVTSKAWSHTGSPAASHEQAIRHGINNAAAASSLWNKFEPKRFGPPKAVEFVASPLNFGMIRRPVAKLESPTVTQESVGDDVENWKRPLSMQAPFERCHVTAPASSRPWDPPYDRAGPPPTSTTSGPLPWAATIDQAMADERVRVLVDFDWTVPADEGPVESRPASFRSDVGLDRPSPYAHLRKGMKFYREGDAVLAQKSDLEEQKAAADAKVRLETSRNPLSWLASQAEREQGRKGHASPTRRDLYSHRGWSQLNSW